MKFTFTFTFMKFNQVISQLTSGTVSTKESSQVYTNTTEDATIIGADLDLT